jgi:Tfp pilus assembly protein PilN
LASAILAVGPVRTVMAAQANRAAEEIEKRSLRAEIEPLRANEAEIRRLQAGMAELAGDTLPWAEWLQALAQNLPDQVVLTGLQADRLGFRVDGGIVGDLPGADWLRWRKALAERHPHWSWLELPDAKPTAVLALQGHWQ